VCFTFSVLLENKESTYTTATLGYLTEETHPLLYLLFIYYGANVSLQTIEEEVRQAQKASYMSDVERQVKINRLAHFRRQGLIDSDEVKLAIEAMLRDGERS